MITDIINSPRLQDDSNPVLATRKDNSMLLKHERDVDADPPKTQQVYIYRVDQVNNRGQKNSTEQGRIDKKESTNQIAKQVLVFRKPRTKDNSPQGSNLTI